MCECLRREDGTWHVDECCSWIMDQFHEQGVTPMEEDRLQVLRDRNIEIAQLREQTKVEKAVAAEYQKASRDAVEKERERCAKIIRGFVHPPDQDDNRCECPQCETVRCVEIAIRKGE